MNNKAIKLWYAHRFHNPATAVPCGHESQRIMGVASLPKQTDFPPVALRRQNMSKPKNDFPDVTGFVLTVTNIKKAQKNICAPRSIVHSVRTLFRCLRTNWKCLGKVNLISVLYTESHQSWCRCLRRKPQPIIFVWYLSMASQTWQELSCWVFTPLFEK